MVSDTRTLESDTSGPAVQSALAKIGFEDVVRRLCTDDPGPIKTNVIELCDECGVVFTVGGTGFSRRDITPQATQELIERQADSISELIRLKGLEHTPFSHLSRGIAGIRGNTLIVNLPGSPAGAAQGVEAIAALLPAILAGLSGEECPVAP